ncbi:MAG TPA: helix-turn-helix domain-containing protein [Thermoanaerobaculia bacterium]|nr:helix-turn-helix domain-containing protein [Thermoanaerobaculia bacterium]
MVTVAEAAERLERDPETIRRWIRSGKLPARKIGLQHMIEEMDLPARMTSHLPAAWQRTATGEPMPDVVAAIQRVRAGH